MRGSLSAAFVLVLLAASVARADDAIVVDHRCADIRQVPESAIEAAKAGLHIAYGHTSHGSQLISGMGTDGGRQLDEFMTANGATPGLYRWNAGGTGGALDLRDRPFSSANDLGNPNRTAWATATRNWLDAHPETNVIVWSWCGQAATDIVNIDTYLDLMEGLIDDYPDVDFVFMTGHLDGTGENGLLHRANEHIRQHCRDHGRILYDFADIESYDPDGQTDYLRLAANDNCDYDSDGNGTRDRNWALDWQNTHTEGVDWWASGAAHSQHLNGNRKGYAAWWLWARLGGWDRTPAPPSGPVGKLKRVAVVGGRKQTGFTVRVDVRVKGPGSAYRVWEILGDVEPPEFTTGEPVDGVLEGLPVTLSGDPGLPAKRRICVQIERDGQVSNVRTAKVVLVAPKIRKVTVIGGRKRSDPELRLDVRVKRPVVGGRVWEDLPGAVPPGYTPMAPVDGFLRDVPLSLATEPGLPRRRTVFVQVTGEAVAAKIRKVIVLLE